MKLSFHQTQSPRINPEFMGIAAKYSQHKRKRISIEQKRHELDSDCQYTRNLDLSLEKRLESKAIELMKLEQIRQRHDEELEFKQHLDQLRRWQIENLKENNTQKRLQNKRNIEEARLQLSNRNKSQRYQIKQDFDSINQKLERTMYGWRQEKTYKHDSVKEGAWKGHVRVNEYHRRRNMKSLNAYKERIQKENELKRDNYRQIKENEKKLAELNQQVDLKKSLLGEIQQEIDKYKPKTKSYIYRSHAMSARKATQNDKEQLLITSQFTSQS